MKKMFENAANILKTLGKIVFIAGTIAFVIIGIVNIARGYNPYVIIGLALLFGGGFGSVISGFGLYGFGKLIETNQIVADNTSKTAASSAKGE